MARSHFSTAIFISIAANATLLAAEEPSQCFQLPSGDTPENLNVLEAAIPSQTEHEVWCYWQLNPHERLVFNADQRAVEPGLAFLIKDAVHPLGSTITYTSVSHGRRQLIQQFTRDFLPNIPLSAEAASRRGLPLTLTAGDTKADSLARVLQELRQEPFTLLAEAPLEEGSFAAQLPDELLPYDAYWWPHNGVPLAAGAFSPLGKYDSAVLARTGQDPASTAWELRYHSLQHVEWGGHCNGWAASSVLYDKVPGPLWDAASRNVFLISDIDGILAEASFCVQWSFFGNRNNGRPGDDPLDIAPALFHRVLRHYIDVEKKPIAFDYEPDASVDNNVISGYGMTISKDSENPRLFHVKTQLRVHDYSYRRHERTSTAPYYDDMVYQYTLETDEQGQIIGGSWQSENPDFLWVPLAQKRCGRENPNIDHRFVEQTLRKLPKAEARVQQWTVPAAQVLEPGQSIRLFEGDVRGAQFHFKLDRLPPAQALMLTVKGYAAYPTLGAEPYDQTFSLAEASEMDLDAVAIQSIDLSNAGSEPLSAADLGTATLQYLGGE